MIDFLESAKDKETIIKIYTTDGSHNVGLVDSIIDNMILVFKDDSPLHSFIYVGLSDIVKIESTSKLH